MSKWNAHKYYLDNAIRRRLEPDRADELQADFNNWRRKRISDAVATRPYYLNLQFSMTAAGVVAPYRAVTPSLSHDVIVVGLKSDVWPARDIILRHTETEQGLVRTGDELDLHLTSDELAGSTVDAGGGQVGTFYLPAPLIIRGGDRLTLEMFKTDTTADPLVANVSLICVRVFHAAYGDVLIDPNESALIDQQIMLREIPQTRLLKVQVEYAAAAAGEEVRNILTPRVEEPLLLRGIRTNMRNSQIELGIQGEPLWTNNPVPIWAVAGENELGSDNYNWTSKPIYLHSHDVIDIRRVINSIDGTLVDPDVGNTITFICETV